MKFDANRCEFMVAWPVTLLSITKQFAIHRRKRPRVPYWCFIGAEPYRFAGGEHG